MELHFQLIDYPFNHLLKFALKLKLFRESFPQSSVKFHVALLHAGNSNKKTKRDFNNPKASGFLGDYGEHRTY